MQKHYVWGALISLVFTAMAAFPALAEVKQVTVEPPVPKSLMQVGFHMADTPFGGITVKRRISSGTILQGTLSLNESSGSLSGRMLLDLGTKGNVFRYVGVGVGTGYQPSWDNGNSYQASIVGVQGFIGIDYPLDWFGRSTPFSTSIEVVAQGIQRTINGKTTFSPRTGVDMGFSYWF